MGVLVFLSISLLSAEEPGDLARTRVTMPFYSGPSVSSTVIGKLPAGSLVRYQGEKALPLARIEVELESGWVSGWCLDAELDFGEEGAKSDTPPLQPEQKRIQGLPRDEGILLKRSLSFYYGAELGTNYGSIGIGSDVYQGFGFLIGARVGFFLAPTTTLDIRTEYSTVGGAPTQREASAVVLGYWDVLVGVIQRVGSFDLAAMGGVAFGLSVPDALPVTEINSPTDLTSPVVGIAGAYGIPLGSLARLDVGVGYRFHLLTKPALVHRFLVSISFVLEG